MSTSNHESLISILVVDQGIDLSLHRLCSVLGIQVLEAGGGALYGLGLGPCMRSMLWAECASSLKEIPNPVSLKSKRSHMRTPNRFAGTGNSSFRASGPSNYQVCERVEAAGDSAKQACQCIASTFRAAFRFVSYDR